MCFIKNEFEKHRQCVQVATKRAAEEGGVAAPLPIPINDDSLRRGTTWHQHCASIATIAPHHSYSHCQLFLLTTTPEGVQHAQAITGMAWACCTPLKVGGQI